MESGMEISAMFRSWNLLNIVSLSYNDGNEVFSGLNEVIIITGPIYKKPDKMKANSGHIVLKLIMRL